MGVLIHIITVLTCIQAVHLYPLQDDDHFLLYNDYGADLENRPYHPYNDELQSSLNFFGATENQDDIQRKKNIDATFIRFGRSATSKTTSRTERSLDRHLVLSKLFKRSPVTDELEASPETPDLPQQYILNHKGCKLRSGQELMKVLLNDPNCIRVFQKTKKENVNDTFIRFGKREAPPEKEFESENSKELR